MNKIGKLKISIKTNTTEFLTISILQNNIKALNEQCSKLFKCDKLQQYSRHECLWIEGIVKPHKMGGRCFKLC